MQAKKVIIFVDNAKSRVNTDYKTIGGNMITNESMQEILKDYVNITHDGSISQAAFALGIDTSNLSKMLKGDRPVSAAVASGLGFIKMDHVFRVKS